MAKISITLVKSLNGRIANQKANAEVLGLTKIGKTVVREDTPAVRGSINKISHLVEVKEIKEN